MISLSEAVGLERGKAPKTYLVTSRNLEEEEYEFTISEWWHRGKLVSPILECIHNYLYDHYDKGYYKLVSVELLPASNTGGK